MMDDEKNEFEAEGALHRLTVHPTGLVRAVGAALALRPAAPVQDGAQRRALQNALRFFAAMLVLTLIARGTAGAAMPVVTLKNPASGTVEQSATLHGTVTREGGLTLPLPDALTVAEVAVRVGQAVHTGDALATFSKTEIADQLAQKKAEQQKQQAQLAQLQLAVGADASGVSNAETAARHANEDYTQAQQRHQALVAEAQAQLGAAKEAQSQAQQALDALLQQTDPLPSPEELAAAREKAQAADSATLAAEQALATAEQAKSDALAAASRSLERAQATLGQAQSDYAKNQASATLTAQSNRADAALVALQIDKRSEEIRQLRELAQQDGILRAPSDATVLGCTLTVGQKTDAGAFLRLSDASSKALASFSLPQEKAEQLAPGQSVSVKRGTSTLTAAVQSIAYAADGETAEITAALPGAETTSWAPGQQLEIKVVFSSTRYDACLPISAVRQDTTGHHVLVVEPKQTALGITNTVARVPVTVLEVSSDGTLAAVSGSIAGAVIVASDRTVTAGAAVRIAE